MLTHQQFTPLLQAGMVQGYEPTFVNALSLDVRLGRGFSIETMPPNMGGSTNPAIDLKDDMRVHWMYQDIGEIDMAPGEMILAHTLESFNLPANVRATFEMRSTEARNGLEQLAAINLWPSFNGTLTLELKNMLRFNTLRLRTGMVIGQVCFHTFDGLIADDLLYAKRGRYNGMKKPHGARLST